MEDCKTFDRLRDLLRFDRSVRRFDASRTIDRDTLVSLVELTRYCASSQNMQPLRYIIVDEKTGKDRLFPLLRWARHLKDWPGPAQSERPSAYLVQLTDTRIAPSLLCDCGLQLQAITLGAAALGISGCIIRNFTPDEVHSALGLEDFYKVEYVLALGYSAETVRLEDLAPGADYSYYRLPDSTHVVPKRPLGELIVAPGKN